MSPLPRVPGYELLQPLGGGPLTHVFKARRSHTDELCAVKLLRDEWADHATAIKLLRREARALFAVRHPHIVRLIDAHVAHPPYAIALELLGGESLRERLQREYSLDLRTAVWVARQTTDGLSALHRAGFVHGDVKPENIRLIDPGTAIIVDLGFAHRPGTDRDIGDDYVLGTASYLAPELYHDATADGFAADWYSFGVTVLEMLTGRVPGPTLSSVQILADVAEDWPVRLLALVDGLVAERPDDRPVGPLVLHELIALEIAALRRAG
jgi:eukaryotic-like serine/threonine-protein kinase